MVPGPSVPPPTPLSSFVSASGTLVIVFVCIIVFSVVLSLIIVAATYIVCEFIFWLMIARHLGDVEEGQRLHTTSPDSVSHHALHRDEMYRASVQNNLRVLAMLERIIRVIEGGREQREHERLQQALERMPPPTSYGIHETESRFRGECSICLEEYVTGDWCREFPVCSHIYHSNCIDEWLKKNPTCPVCRNCVLGA